MRRLSIMTSVMLLLLAVCLPCRSAEALPGSFVDAAQMMLQAAQYFRMGTDSAKKACHFLLVEIIRRFPDSLEATEADLILQQHFPYGPPPKGEQKRYEPPPDFRNPDPEPEWIVPDRSPEPEWCNHLMGPIDWRERFI